MVCYESKRQKLMDENTKTMNHFVFSSLFLTARYLVVPVLHTVDIKYGFQIFVIFLMLLAKFPIMQCAELTFISVCVIWDKS
jgi:hypothetical protein